MKEQTLSLFARNFSPNLLKAEERADEVSELSAKLDVSNWQ